MTAYKVATTFDVLKLKDEKPEVFEWDMILSHPGLKGWFMFQEDIEYNFFDLVDNGWDKLEDGRLYRVFLVMIIRPEYSYHHEYGKDFDGWDWEVLVLSYEGLGEMTDNEPSF